MLPQDNPPLTLALIVADAMLRDLGTGKIAIHGIYSAIGAREFPWMHPRLMVYGALTDGRPGKMSLLLRVIDAAEERDAVAEARGEVEFPDPFAVVEFVLVLGGLVFPEPGEYRLQLFADGTPLIERRLQVVPVPPPQAEAGNP